MGREPEHVAREALLVVAAVLGDGVRPERCGEGAEGRGGVCFDAGVAAAVPVEEQAIDGGGLRL